MKEKRAKNEQCLEKGKKSGVAIEMLKLQKGANKEEDMMGQRQVRKNREILMLDVLEGVRGSIS